MSAAVPAQSNDPTALDDPTRQEVRGRIAAVFPDCPDEIADRFIDALDRPTEELAAEAQLLLDKPYGRNHILVADGAYGLSFALLLPGQSTSLHFHSTRREFFCVRRGTLRLTSGERSMVLQRFACGHSTPGVPHSLANGGAGPLEVLEIFSPALLEDKVRVKDRYERKLGSVGVRE
jgi:mannose-6-phosphate isomerase-like protein (cupin superfamily)